MHPQFIFAGLAATAIPLLIHLLNRRRYVRVPFAAMRFLHSAAQQNARRVRVEQIALLLVRSLLVFAICFAVARPVLPFNTLGAVSRQRLHHVVLIDNSASTRQILPLDGGLGDSSDAFAVVSTESDGRSATRMGTRTAFSEIVRVADALVDSFAENDAVSLITVSHPARAEIEFASVDRRRVVNRLADLSATYQEADLVGAFRLTGSIVGQTGFPAGHTRVYLVTDLARSGWEHPRVSAGTIGAARELVDALGTNDMTVVDVGDDSAGNVAIVGLISADGSGEYESYDVQMQRIGDRGRIGIANMPVRMVAQVVNYSDTPADVQSLRIELDGQVIRRLELRPIAPGQPEFVEFSIAADGEGTHIVEAALDSDWADSVVYDDTRRASVEFVDRIPVLLLDDRAGGRGSFGGADFLKTALQPGGGDGDTVFTVRIAEPTDFLDERLGDYRLIGLCDVKSLDETGWARLRDFVADGGGLFVFASPRADREQYNSLGFVGGDGVLPGSLVEFIESPTGNGREGFLRSSRLQGDAFSHPVLHDFSSRPDSGLFQTRILGFWELRPDAAASVLLRHVNGLPALVEKSIGRGRVIQCSFPAGMTWTNLPAKGDFVALVVGMACHLGTVRGVNRDLHPSDFIDEPLVGGDWSASLKVELPDGTVGVARLNVHDKVYTANYGPIEQIGVHRLTTNRGTTSYATNVSPLESDIRRADPSTIGKRMGHPIRVLRADELLQTLGGRGTTTELAGISLGVVALLLVLDTLLSYRFGVGRQ
jgi:Aerotolerance regulator N-terminal